MTVSFVGRRDRTTNRTLRKPPNQPPITGFYLEIEPGRRLKTKHYDKRDDFTFPIVNFTFISSNIPASPAYGVYISQLRRYSRACDQYSGFLDRAQLLTQKLG